MRCRTDFQPHLILSPYRSFDLGLSLIHQATVFPFPGGTLWGVETGTSSLTVAEPVSLPSHSLHPSLSLPLFPSLPPTHIFPFLSVPLSPLPEYLHLSLFCSLVFIHFLRPYISLTHPLPTSVLLLLSLILFYLISLFSSVCRSVLTPYSLVSFLLPPQPRDPPLLSHSSALPPSLRLPL